MNRKQSGTQHVEMDQRGNAYEDLEDKYNALDQLVCVLCNSVIKSDILWTAHLGSRQHKEKLDVMRTAGPTKPPELVGKRKAEFIEPVPHKKLKEKDKGVKHSDGVPSDFFDSKRTALPKNSSEKTSEKTPIKSILKSSNSQNSTNQLGLGSYSSSEEDDSEDEDEKGKQSMSSSVTPSMQSSIQLSHPSLPPDFFDSGVKTEEPVEEEKTKTMADVLPEGFFDNPKADAKVRQVEYKDKMEEEWEMFQRAMKEESHVSEAIMEEEDEQINVDRNIDEIDDQINRWKEINTLEIKKEEIMQRKNEAPGKEEDDSDDDLGEEDLEEFLNWRSKKLK
ncbi:hypothetical protein FSP39_004492 [Pinctada imbricata]|uniref:Zinc finger protein 830 n=1 Tax=Pinctada imbricata TaxID=66713 RepID=A0AA88XVE1_PINIB|nr:hypothetical protein FSP39_004492 [Pinctada imbricata]